MQHHQIVLDIWRVVPPFSSMKRSQGKPVIIDTSNTLIGLERIELGKGNHSEKWLQKLIHQHPDLLPIAEIEPGFGQPVAVAMEVPCGHGNIDNVFVTPTGDIIVIETNFGQTLKRGVKLSRRLWTMWPR